MSVFTEIPKERIYEDKFFFIIEKIKEIYDTSEFDTFIKDLKQQLADSIRIPTRSIEIEEIKKLPIDDPTILACRMRNQAVFEEKAAAAGESGKHKALQEAERDQGSDLHRQDRERLQYSPSGYRDQNKALPKQQG
jgi:hypothetical protein